ncbi:hypothetical protein K5549_002948 [Capra hircus]|uniref:Uncharacterized protein n=1 Tax=Capra hircus TaxID=9925 RepID=A0A452FQ23_CAPHI|nr:hypothetical protein K5549_002948 [Capra hircus]
MELARELRNNLHPHPSAHSPYGNSTLSPGSQGLPLDSSVMALFNASLLPLASYPYSGAWGSDPRGLTFQNKLSSLCIIGKIFFWSPAPSPSAFGQFLFLISFSSSPQDGEGGEPRN